METPSSPSPSPPAVPHSTAAAPAAAAFAASMPKMPSFAFAFPKGGKSSAAAGAWPAALAKSTPDQQHALAVYKKNFEAVFLALQLKEEEVEQLKVGCHPVAVCVSGWSRVLPGCALGPRPACSAPRAGRPGASRLPQLRMRAARRRRQGERRAVAVPRRRQCKGAAAGGCGGNADRRRQGAASSRRVKTNGRRGGVSARRRAARRRDCAVRGAPAPALPPTPSLSP